MYTCISFASQQLRFRNKDASLMAENTSQIAMRYQTNYALQYTGWPHALLDTLAGRMRCLIHWLAACVVSYTGWPHALLDTLAGRMRCTYTIHWLTITHRHIHQNIADTMFCRCGKTSARYDVRYDYRLRLNIMYSVCSNEVFYWK